VAKELIIVGAGGHAHSIVDVVESRDDYRIRGFVDFCAERSDKFSGYEVLGTLEDLERLMKTQPCDLFVAVGDNFQRHRLYKEIKERSPDAKFAVLIHSNAYLSPRASTGEGSVLMAGAVVSSGCQMGRGVIINTNSTVDHDGLVCDFVSLAPGVSVGGNVNIGERSSIGLGAKIIHKIDIGSDVCVGAGSLVLKSIERDSVVVYGSPSNIVRERAPDEQYL